MNENKLSFCTEKFFRWILVKNSDFKQNLLKLRKNNKKWKSYYFVLYFNYLVYFKPGKGGSGAPKEDSEIPKGVIPLELVTETKQIQPFEEKGIKKDTAFEIPLPDVTYQILAENDKIMESWVKTLWETVEPLKNTKRESEETVIKTLENGPFKIFPQNNFNLPSKIDPDEAEKWMQDMKKYREEYKKWSPYIRSLSLFAEFQTGRIKGYWSWFINQTKGVNSLLNKSEQEILDNWESEIKKGPDDIKKALETLFYKEDMISTIEHCNKCLKMIDRYNQYEKEFNDNIPPKFQKEKKELEQLLHQLNTFPSIKDISLDKYSGGNISDGESEWIWNLPDYSLKRIKYSPSPLELQGEIEFTAKNHPYQFLNPTYGIVLWNQKYCIWTHPKCPFIIDYQWFENKGIFKQRFLKSSNSNGKVIPSPSLTDWQFIDGILRAVTVGERNPLPEVPSITEYQIQGNIPPPAMLIVAIYPKIRDTIYSLLN